MKVWHLRRLIGDVGGWGMGDGGCVTLQKAIVIVYGEMRARHVACKSKSYACTVIQQQQQQPYKNGPAE